MEYSHIVAIPRPHDERDLLLGSVAAPVVIPPTYLPDNGWLIRNFQGKTTFCGEHAGTHLKAILDRIQSNGMAFPRKTPRYGAIKLKNPKSPVCDGYAADAGTDMRSIFKWLQKVGAPDFEPLEDNVALPIAQYLNPAAATPAMDAQAAKGQIQNYAFGKTDFDSICRDIYRSGAVLLLIKCDDGFWGTLTPTFTTPTYGHFVIADGFTPNQLRVIDSADPDEAFSRKMIAKKYITPQFIIESGTAIDTAQANAIKSAIVTDSAAVVNILANDNTIPVAVKKNALQMLMEFLLALLPQKVGSASPQNPMTTVNATLLTAAMGFITVGVTTISTNWIAGCVEFAIGIGAIIVYEKLPPSSSSQ